MTEVQRDYEEKLQRQREDEMKNVGTYLRTMKNIMVFWCVLTVIGIGVGILDYMSK
jgi:hypothetical protein